MFLHSPFLRWPLAGGAIAPAAAEVSDQIKSVESGLQQQLSALLRHSLIDGVCVVRYFPERAEPEMVLVKSDRLMVCPVPPLAKIEAILLTRDWEMQYLGRTLLPSYHLYSRRLESSMGELQYIVVWHGSELQPWQEYMLEQQVALLNQENAPIAVTPQQVLTVLKDVEHQIRTPLSLIQLYADLLDREASQDGQKIQIQQIQSTIGGLQASLKKLTQGELRDRPKRHEVNLKLLLLDVLEVLHPMLEKRQINLALSFQDCTIALDDWQIRQVFQNIVDNAIWFSPMGGTLTCRCQRFQKEMLVQISDQGAGLSIKDQQNLFQTNYSQRPGGTGMGMMIAKQIIQQHGGQIWAENLPSGGAQFSITLPC
jgi:signal transduction histidine kinase